MASHCSWLLCSSIPTEHWNWPFIKRMHRQSLGAPTFDFRVHLPAVNPWYTSVKKSMQRKPWGWLLKVTACAHWGSSDSCISQARPTFHLFWSLEVNLDFYLFFVIYVRWAQESPSSVIKEEDRKCTCVCICVFEHVFTCVFHLLKVQLSASTGVNRSFHGTVSHVTERGK